MLDQPDLVACTGATTEDFIDANDAAGMPEWSPSMGQSDLVTFTFGGDDIGFRSTLEQCLGLSSLVAATENAGAAEAGIPDYVAPLPSDPGHTCPSASIIEGRITALATTYRNLVAEVAQKAVVPGGNIVVLGYPDLIELPKFWAEWEQLIGSCWGIGTGDATELRGLAGDLNATIGQAVSSFDAQPDGEREGVTATFVDVNTANGSTPSDDPNLFEPSSGTRHNLCGAVSWINGGTLTASLSPFNHSFHPNQAGTDNMGALAAKVIRNLNWSGLMAPSAPEPPSSSPVSTSTAPTCSAYKQMSDPQKENAIVAMEAAHQDKTAPLLVRGSVYLFCLVYPQHTIDGVYDGSL